MPSEDELAAQFSVSRPVVNKALTILRREGAVKVVRGKGTYVNDIPVITRDSSTRQLTSVREEGRGPFEVELRHLGLSPRSDLIKVGEAQAPAEVAALFGIEEGASVAIRHREMYADDVALQLATSYIPWEIAEGSPITENDTGPGGIYSRLADLGHAVADIEETVSVRPPTDEEARFLHLEPDHRVYVVERVARAADDHPVEVCHMVMPAHQWRLKYRWPAS